MRPVTIEDGRVVEHGIPPHVQAVMGRLRRWANRLRGRYGVPIYLCGSALRADNSDPRDWDVRIMLPDERFALAFGPVDEWRDEGCTGKWTRTRFRWSDQCVKDTQDFVNWCHLNGDVQIYPESHAATMYANQPRLRLDTFPDPAEPDLLARLATAEAERAYLADRVDALNGQQDGLMQDRRTAEAERDRLRGLLGRVLAWDGYGIENKAAAVWDRLAAALRAELAAPTGSGAPLRDSGGC